MEEIKTEGIVVGGEDCGEADRLVRILTPSFGVITARMRGVKKEKAKLKFAAMPFSFCEYVLMKRGTYYSVKTAAQTESLFGVASSPDKYLMGSVVLETASVTAGGSDSADIFFDLLTTLERLIYSDVAPRSIGLNFVYRALVRGGHIAPTEREAAYNVPVKEQTSLDDAAATRMLRAYLALLEKKYYAKIRSAELIK